MQLDPLVPHVVRHGGMLACEDLHLVVLVNDFAARIDHERAIEETLGKLRMLDLGLGHDESAEISGQVTEIIGLRTRDIDRGAVHVLDVIPVEDFIREALQRAFRNRNQPHRQIDRREPYRGARELSDVVQIALDIGTLLRAPHHRLKCERHVLFDYPRITSHVVLLTLGSRDVSH